MQDASSVIGGGVSFEKELKVTIPKLLEGNSRKNSFQVTYPGEGGSQKEKKSHRESNQGEPTCSRGQKKRSGKGFQISALQRGVAWESGA